MLKYMWIYNKKDLLYLIIVKVGFHPVHVPDLKADVGHY